MIFILDELDDDDEPDDFGLEQPGCLFGERCLNPNFIHYTDECFTQEMFDFPALEDQ